jgi:hypothetical protein
MPDPTGAERARRYRERQAGRLPPPEVLICAACGNGRSGRYGALCLSCWKRLTPEGRAANAAAVARSRARRRQP